MFLSYKTAPVSASSKQTAPELFSGPSGQVVTVFLSVVAKIVCGRQDAAKTKASNRHKNVRAAEFFLIITHSF
jgi:hypothetical protein